MKILILSDDFAPRALGGAAAVALNVARGMLARGNDVYVLTSVRNASDAGDYLVDGVKVRAFVSSYDQKWRAYKSLYNSQAIDAVKNILAEIKPDVVHAHNIHNYISYHALALAKESGARVVLTAHDCMLFHYGKLFEFTDSKDLKVRDLYNYKVSPWKQFTAFKQSYNPFRNIIIKKYLRTSVDVITAVSAELAKALDDNGIHGAMVVHNALDVKNWIALENEVDDFIKVNDLESYRRVLFAGRLTPAKGGDLLIEALKISKDSCGPIALIIVGQKDEYTDKMISDAGSSGIKIVVTGWKQEKDLPNIYKATDIVVFPSACFDTFGMVNLEAMASKKPVLATCFGGAKEVVLDGKTGYIINPYDIKRFAELVCGFLGDKAKSKVFGDAGHDRVINHFNIDKQVTDYLALYKR